MVKWLPKRLVGLGSTLVRWAPMEILGRLAEQINDLETTEASVHERGMLATVWRGGIGADSRQRRRSVLWREGGVCLYG